MKCLNSKRYFYNVYYININIMQVCEPLFLSNKQHRHEASIEHAVCLQQS